MRGIKLGELLLKQTLWFAQSSRYNLAYLTTYSKQTALISLIEFYGFNCMGENNNGELIYEHRFSNDKLELSGDQSVFEAGCKNYPRFIKNQSVHAFGIPIKEKYHDILYPDLRSSIQVTSSSKGLSPEPLSRPGNTIRKAYLCRAPSNLGDPGSLLFFYKGSSNEMPSQAVTAIGLLESISLAKSTNDLMRMTGSRSVYSKVELAKWNASSKRPVKVINYLLIHYIDPPIDLDQLKALGVVKCSNLPQSIYKIEYNVLKKLLQQSNLNFDK